MRLGVHGQQPDLNGYHQLHSDAWVTCPCLVGEGSLGFRIVSSCERNRPLAPVRIWCRGTAA